MVFLIRDYQRLEDTIIQIFNHQRDFHYKGETYRVSHLGKPRPSKGKGECKTDIYISAFNRKQKNETLAFKLSAKKRNSSYSESYISHTRARELFGENWSNLIKASTTLLKKEFEKSVLIPESNKGKVTLGWRLDLEPVKKTKRTLSHAVDLPDDLIKDYIYKGDNLPLEKKDGIIQDYITNEPCQITNCGIATHLIEANTEDLKELSIESLLNLCVPIDDMPITPLRFAFKACNYDLIKNKPTNGYRPLAVSVHWTDDKKASPTLIFHKPLLERGKDGAERIKQYITKNKQNA